VSGRSRLLRGYGLVCLVTAFKFRTLPLFVAHSGTLYISLGGFLDMHAVSKASKVKVNTLR
jgi:hypothetical protein